MADAALAFSFLALVLTKAADFWTTLRYVGPEAECNPLARMLFQGFGFIGGLLVVAVTWGIIVAMAYGYAWWLGGSLERWVTALTGLLIAGVQWDTARFNATGRSSWFTRKTLMLYHRWLRMWRER